MAISVSAYAIAMLPYGVRLGEGDLDNGQTIGNPILVGMPSALIVILAVSDRGRYLLMESNLIGRLVLCLTAAQWLIFSGSRGSWLVTITSLLLVFSFNKRSRKPLLISLVLLSILAAVVLQVTDRGAQTANTFDRTVDSNRTLANRTSGRSVMWSVLPAIFAKSPVWGWGPGMGAQVDKLFTGRTLLFHSLYLQVIVETGLLGAIPLAILIGCAVHRSILHLRRFGEVTPLLGIVGFMLLGVSVTAFDILSGILFGLALTPREIGPRFAARQLWAAFVEEVGS
jgi:O-antigen ligase